MAAAAVFGVPDERLGERVIAALLPEDGCRIDPEEMAVFTEQRLSRHKRPTEWITVTALPCTSTGKVRKHLLRQAYDDGVIGLG